MLRIIQNSSSAGAKSYYSTADYYSESQELVGKWRGIGAVRLGLTGDVGKREWDALCDNRDPVTGRTLTARRRSDRRVGYDFNFHVPKSVSLLFGLSRDERILDAFHDSVNETMRDIESEMKTRVRRSGRNDDRITGNIVAGEFIHFTARPVDGVPDPHLHAHVMVFNVTWDEQEARWKAAQFADLKRDGPYFEAMFHSRMALRLVELGLPISRTKSGWEIDGIPADSLAKFSRRTSLIEAKAKAKGITEPAAKGQLGASTREKKRGGLSSAELQAMWRSRLSAKERSAIEDVQQRLGCEPTAPAHPMPADAIDASLDHSFERKSVVPEREVLAHALRYSVGQADPSSIVRDFESRDLLRADRGGRRFVTTHYVLDEERHMIDFARGGRGTCRPLREGAYTFRRAWLNDGQRRAILHVLNSRDRITLIRGAAGVGKTAMMQEAVEAIKAGGQRVCAFAPSASASRGVLRQEGFDNAETVARLLCDPQLQESVRGQVAWIDEAGLLGTKAMGQVFELAAQLEARVILSGDVRQHGSVTRGAALRLLETEAGLVPAEIKEIQRQKGSYKQAVQALSEGRTEDGFRQLQRLGWIREIAGADRYKTIAGDYIAALDEGKTGLVVSPTHLEAGWITQEIRSRLRQAGKLDADERQFQLLENANLTLAERRDATNYLPGDVLVFHQNAKGFRKGERTRLGAAALPLDQAAHFQIFHSETISIAAGDLLRVTRNGTTAGGNHRLNNGAVYEVQGFTSNGDVQLTNGWIVDKNYGFLDYGHVVTSHASQSRTVDRVFVGQSSHSFPASSREQFYVSASRAREQVIVYSDDAAALLAAVGQSDERTTATELLSQQCRRNKQLRIRIFERDAQLDETRMHQGRQRELIHER